MGNDLYGRQNYLHGIHDTQIEPKHIPIELKRVFDLKSDNRDNLEPRSTKFLEVGYDTGNGKCLVCGCSYTECHPTCPSRQHQVIVKIQ